MALGLLRSLSALLFETVSVIECLDSARLAGWLQGSLSLHPYLQALAAMTGFSRVCKKPELRSLSL